jgi:hypothetical protein
MADGSKLSGGGRKKSMPISGRGDRSKQPFTTELMLKSRITEEDDTAHKASRRRGSR